MHEWTPSAKTQCRRTARDLTLLIHSFGIDLRVEPRGGEDEGPDFVAAMNVLSPHQVRRLPSFSGAGRLMPNATQTPWTLGVRADTQDADHRAEIGIVLRKEAVRPSRGVLLETCHRVELYGFGPIPTLVPSLSALTGDRAVLHLMRVAAGLDSSIVGEDQVLHQVRDALTAALRSGALDPRLQRLFETAIAAGRRARRGRHGSSANLAHSAMEWLNARSAIKDRAVLVIGAGHMGSALAHKAALLGARLTIASRNPTRARRLAHAYGGDSADLAEAASLVGTSAAIAVALGGPWRELQPSEAVLPPIADISAPPAVSSEVRAQLDGGFLSIDDLYHSHDPVPRGYIENATRVVEAKSKEYLAWLKTR